MKVFDQLGRELEISSVYGEHEDDLQIDEIFYVSPDHPETVSPEVIEYIEKTQAEKIYELWFDKMNDWAEQLADRQADRE